MRNDHPASATPNALAGHTLKSDRLLAHHDTEVKNPGVHKKFIVPRLDLVVGVSGFVKEREVSLSNARDDDT
jgi:hypothetical protein